METKQKMKEAYAERDGMFYAIPEFARIFKQYEYDIRYYNRYQWSAQTTKESLIRKRDELLNMVKN